ncbi:hypothetical protein [Brevirhabdus sp.]|uniref:hypothetical protein n=1 Tax=Brevirhabdus sp. TaxID=2004514 RepID=UPI0040584B46
MRRAGRTAGQRGDRLAGACLTLIALLTAASTLLALAANPFAQPLINRSTNELRQAIDRALLRELTPDRLRTEVQAALEAQDRDRLDMLLDLAQARGLTVPPDLRARTDALRDARSGLLEKASDCALCAYDITRCPTLSQMAACALPVEISPLGDLNALRRAGAAWLTGAPVDRLDTGLAVAGLSTTALVGLSAGSSLPVKLGATTLRLARRLGSLSARLGDSLADLSRRALRWDGLADVAIGRRPLDAVVNAGAMTRLTHAARDVGRLRQNTSSVETLRLLRVAETPEDLTRLARLSDATGPSTRATLDILGPSRAFRLLTRLSDLARLALGLITVLLAQIGGLVGSAALWLLRRHLRRRGQHRACCHDPAARP